MRAAYALCGAFVLCACAQESPRRVPEASEAISPEATGEVRASPSEGRLAARASSSARGDASTGVGRIRIGERTAFLFVPPDYARERPAAFALMLHGAGGNVEKAFGFFRPFADERNLILLAPRAQGRTWDFILGGFGEDVSFIDAALRKVFANYAIDPERVAVGGFSDGASYALSLGITNGDLFTHVIAFSPGFASPAARRGRPSIFISHGTTDNVLPIDQTSRRLAPELEDAGYDVTFREFAGGHAAPPALVDAALVWFLEEPPP